MDQLRRIALAQARGGDAASFAIPAEIREPLRLRQDQLRRMILAEEDGGDAAAAAIPSDYVWQTKYKWLGDGYNASGAVWHHGPAPGVTSGGFDNLTDWNKLSMPPNYTSFSAPGDIPLDDFVRMD